MTDTISKETIEKILDQLKENTRRECIRIKTKVSDGPLSLTASKFGGVPYWPDIRNYPIARGRKVYMTLLAQINFADLPENSTFPRKGLLQFFLLDEDWEWKVIYHENVDNSIPPLPYYGEGKIDLSKKISDYIPTTLMPETIIAETTTGEQRVFNFNGKDFFWGDAGFPVQGELALEFTLDYDYVNVTENRFEDEFRKAAEQLGVILPKEIDIPYSILAEEEPDEYLDCGHKLFGHPYFIQNDDRDDGDELLFQMDSTDPGETDSKNNIVIGDAGVCRFFIPYEDLRKMNFSHVSYSWDCC